MAAPIKKNTLFYGDNLQILREYIADESVDLIYLDPPFNSKRTYNVLFKDESGDDSAAQIAAFDDTWHWDASAEEAYHELVTEAPDEVSKLIGALREFIGTNQMMAYLVMMAIRLVELHRVLKPTGSLYLHCDPTASHYLKIVLDAIFGAENFRNEIIWHYRRWTNSQSQFQSMHDVILFYSRTSENTFNFTEVDMSASQRKKFERGWDSNVIHTKDRKYAQLIVYKREKLEQAVASGKMNLDKYENIVYRDKPVVAASDVIIMPVLNSQAKERLGYPTQKPVALLERIIRASSNEGEVVLDPFCGCGTSIAAAEKLDRKWIGIDITHLAITLQKNRLRESFPEVEFGVVGEPETVEAARYLAEEIGRFQFEWWALSLVRAKPVKATKGSKRGKKGADKGIDGVITFIDGARRKPQRVLVQVKSGKVSSRDIRDLVGTVEREKAVLGVFITLEKPSKPMRTEAVSAGFYESLLWGGSYPKIQILTIEELLAGAKVEMPTAIRAFKKAERIQKNAPTQGQMNL